MVEIHALYIDSMGVIINIGDTSLYSIVVVISIGDMYLYSLVSEEVDFVPENSH